MSLSFSKAIDADPNPSAHHRPTTLRPNFRSSISTPSTSSKPPRYASEGVAFNSRPKLKPLLSASTSKLSVPCQKRSISNPEAIPRNRTFDAYANSGHLTANSSSRRSSNAAILSTSMRTPGAWNDDIESDHEPYTVRDCNSSGSLKRRKDAENAPDTSASALRQIESDEEKRSDGEEIRRRKRSLDAQNDNTDERRESFNEHNDLEGAQALIAEEESTSETSEDEGADGEGSMQDLHEFNDEHHSESGRDATNENPSRHSSRDCSPTNNISRSSNTQPELQRLNEAEPPSAITNSIFKIMMKPVDYENRWKKGSIYVCSIRGRPGYVKIGYTSGKVNARLRQIFKCLPRLYFENVPHESHYQISYHERTEQLIFADLWNERQRMTGCTCKIKPPKTKEHKEFFEIEEAKAHSCVKKWRDWMDSTPYDQHGKLHDKWANRIRYFTANQANMEALNAVHNTDKRWDPLMKPSGWEDFRMDVHAFFNEERSPRRGRLEAMKDTDLIGFFRHTCGAMVLFCSLRMLPLWMIIVVFSPLASLVWTLA